MVDREELVRAVELQRRSYNLLRWLSSSISKNVIRFDRAHDYLDEEKAAEDWIKGHYLNLPPDCRPEREELTAFARFFATYLTTSFDLVPLPTWRATTNCGCWCHICMYLESATHLKTKKVTRRDKERSEKLKVAAVRQLAFEHNVPLGQQEAERLIDSPANTKDAALVAYGQQLIERTHGRSAGPAVLALWRQFAWTQTALKKDFHLDAEEILRAKESLIGAIADVKNGKVWFN